MIRDQQRARHAYACVQNVPAGLRDDYKVLVNSLGSTILRSGLAASMSYLERNLDEDKKKSAAGLLLEHLAGADIPGLNLENAAEALAPSKIPATVRGLELEDYVLATRELLKVLVWFRRAVQAPIWK